jgi:hypothetical protein
MFWLHLDIVLLKQFARRERMPAVAADGPWGLNLRFYVRFEAATLPRSVGTDGKGSCRIGDGAAGHLSYGPYLELAAGKYTAGFYVRRRGNVASGFIDIDVCCDGGSRTLAARRIAASDILTEIHGWLRIDFIVETDIIDTEVRLSVPERLIVEIRELVIFKRDASYGALYG